MGSSSGGTQPPPRKSQPAPFQRRVVGFVVLLAIPGILASGVLVWLQPWKVESKLSLLGFEIILCALIGAALRDHIVRPLQTLANVVGSLREEDYSFRARLAVPDDALGELSLEVNALADLLSRQRTGAIEAAALLQRVVEEVDIPIFAFDPSGKLRLVNSAGERLLQQASEKLRGKTASELGLIGSLSCENESLLSLPFASGTRWVVRRSSFRQQGIPHTLVVLSDVSRALREEERSAWQRLIRVIGHELNNSLAPIKSIAGSLKTELSKTNLDDEQRQDFEHGLAIIEARAAALNRFLQAYRQLAQMPPPELQPCSISTLVTHVAALETRVRVHVIPGPDITLLADLGQLEHMLINLLRNATEAVLSQAALEPTTNVAEHAGGAEFAEVTISWKSTEKDVILTIQDNGPGLINPANAFVPFYTTKPQGSGIGLVLSRQIVEGHGGTIEMLNRRAQRGCEVKVTLPQLPARRSAGAVVRTDWPKSC
jgi:two-component system, NtrC family, nitrogen regulation sensor histidine kinase NtrY